MTSMRQIKANGANARASTGPKTPAGKNRAAQNARQHGLNMSVATDPNLSAEIEKLASEIAGKNAGAQAKELSRRIAEAQADLVRIRGARNEIPLRELSKQGHISSRGPIGNAGSLENLALIFLNRSEKFAAIDSYERRARSRRKFAIRIFDLASARHGFSIQRRSD